MKYLVLICSRHFVHGKHWMCIPLFLWMWTSICSWHFYEIGCNAYHFCRLFQILKKMYNESVIPLYIYFFQKQNQNGSVIPLNIIQRNHTFVILSCFNPHCTMGSWFRCVFFPHLEKHYDINSIVRKFCTPFCAMESRYHIAFWGGVILEFWEIVGANNKTSLGQ